MDPLSIALVVGVALAGVAGTVFAAQRATQRAHPDDNGQRATSPPDDPSSESTQQQASENAPAEFRPPVPDPAWRQLQFGLGDVVQHETEARWFQSGIVAIHGERVVAGLLLCREQGKLLAALVYPKDNREVFWLKQCDDPLPDNAPSRVEVAGQIFDRDAAYICRLRCQGSEAPQLSEGRLAVYRNSRGAGAVLLSSRSETLAFVGEVLDEGAYDRLGDVTEAAAAGLE